jgi:MYXO-CTERM domain-containing protein
MMIAAISRGNSTGAKRGYAFVGLVALLLIWSLRRIVANADGNSAGVQSPAGRDLAESA